MSREREVMDSRRQPDEPSREISRARRRCRSPACRRDWNAQPPASACALRGEEKPVRHSAAAPTNSSLVRTMLRLARFARTSAAYTEQGA